jgi:type II secretory pathway component PulK
MIRQPRRGFATVMALVSLVLVGITIAGLMTRISMQAHRTEAESRRVQREQIEIAQALGSSQTKLPRELEANLNRR